MINIISNEIFKPEWLVTGQTKVFRNLLKGLDRINYPYVLNQKHAYCGRLWIYNDFKAVRYLKDNKLENTKVIVGPDGYSHEILSNLKLNNDSCLLIEPSEWTKEYVEWLGFKSCKCDFWPSGIDTDIFSPSPGVKDLVLIYFKQRFRFELSLVISVMQEKKIKYKVIEYGDYTEQEYLALLNRSKYIVWIGRQESQGIAMGEALSKNIPILVWEVSCLGHWQSKTKKEKRMFNDEELSYIGARAATYFNDNCGRVFYCARDISFEVDYMEANLSVFKPREYVLKNLSIEGQARAFIGLFDKYWQKSSDIILNKSVGNWRNEWVFKSVAKVYYKYNQIKKCFK